jgi:hypothetical protein
MCPLADEFSTINIADYRSYEIAFPLVAYVILSQLIIAIRIKLVIHPSMSGNQTPITGATKR